MYSMICGWCFFLKMEKMMSCNLESGSIDDSSDSSNGQLLRDIEEISKALYLDHYNHQRSLICSSDLRPKSLKKSHFSDLKSKPKLGFGDEDGWLKKVQKPSSIFGWKRFKALSHVRQRKLSCCFFCHVHCAENLCSDFDGVSVSVNWKRKENVLSTRFLRVENGMVEFEETLMSKCFVYCDKNGPGSFVKYEPKHFLLYASVDEAMGLDIGKHWVDLTRLLPLTIEDLEEDKCSGKWSTSFKLAGKAKGATLHVSFAFLVAKDGLTELGGNMKVPTVLSLEGNELNRVSSVDDVGLGKRNARLRRVGSVPNCLTDTYSNPSQCLDVKVDYSNSINVLYEKLDEGNVDSSAKFDVALKHLESLKLAPNLVSCTVMDFSTAEYDDTEFPVVEKGIELEQFAEEEKTLNASAVEPLDVSSVEVIDVAEIFVGEGIPSDEETKSNGKDEVSCCAINDTLVDKHSVSHAELSDTEKGLLYSHKLSFSDSLDLDVSLDEICNEIKVNHKASKMVKSLSLDDVAKSVADDFFDLLQGASTPSVLSSSGNLESPRERLLREFEEDMTTSGSFLLGVDIDEDEVDAGYAISSLSSLDFEIEGIGLLPVIDTAPEESVKHSSKSKLKAELLEHLETQSLMQSWGLNEEVFHSSAHYSMGGFGSPIYVPPDEPVGLTPLAEGLGSLLRLKDGGFLRSMSPLIFQNAKNCGSLVLQASKPVVLPAELGSNIMEILQCMASVGIEKLSKQLHHLMPLEELSGMIMQQLAWEASEAQGLESPASSLKESDFKFEADESSHVPDCSYSNLHHIDCDLADLVGYVSVKDLAPLVLDKIEVLLMDGLKIQSGMSDHNAPSCIRVKSATDFISRNRIAHHSDYPSDLLGVSDTVNYVEELLDCSLSLDEWLGLDAVKFAYKSLLNEHTMKLLAAHHVKPSHCSCNESREENMQDEFGKGGNLGDNLTVALMTQLRDPLRNYEPVGAPMLGLFQVERVSPPVNEQNDSSSTEQVEDMVGKINVTKHGKTGFSRFEVNEVHVAGLNTESGVPDFWASRRQQQSGTRWLLASGLTKNRDNHFSKSSSVTTLSTRVLRNTYHRNFLWSISHPIHGIASDLLNLPQDPPIRNPDIRLPEEVL